MRMRLRPRLLRLMSLMLLRRRRSGVHCLALINRLRLTARRARVVGFFGRSLVLFGRPLVARVLLWRLLIVGLAIVAVTWRRSVVSANGLRHVLLRAHGAVAVLHRLPLLVLLRRVHWLRRWTGLVWIRARERMVRQLRAKLRPVAIFSARLIVRRHRHAAIVHDGSRLLLVPRLVKM